MPEKKRAPGLSLPAILLVALSLSIGWGVRGNWGHEYGAMIPGALAAVSACLLSGREDWRRRFAYFGFFGAVGWCFGGCMSYMQVIAYTHSGHLASAVYGFGCLFAIGFLWGCAGGGFTALAAFLDRERLTEFFTPFLAICASWLVGLSAVILLRVEFDRLDWLDTDWLLALLALPALIVLLLVRRRLCWATSFLLHMTIGWWLGFLILANLLDLHMTPPRSDSWAGMLGMVIGMIVYFLRQRMHGALFASLLTGIFAGIGFSCGNMVKLAGISSGYATNWHSILEQLFGFISGIGVAVTMGWQSTRAPQLDDDSNRRPWTELASVVFILLFVTFVNIRKNVPAVWLPNKILREGMHGISAGAWFNMAYLAVAIVGILLVLRHRRRPLAIVPASALGRGQLLYLLFLWWIVVWNLSRCVPFHPQRLVTEGVIHLNACICTALILLLPRQREEVAMAEAPDYARLSLKAGVALLAVLILSTALNTAVVRGVYGDKFAGHGGLHIRFGPNATTHKRD